MEIDPRGTEASQGMKAPIAHRLVETLDEMAYLDGCRPETAHAVIVTDADGVESSDGHMYCRRCCWDVRGRSLLVVAEMEDGPCHCEGCGTMLCYTLSADGARRSADLLEGDVSGLRCDDRYHVARMIEACPEGPVLDLGRRMTEHDRDV